MPPIVGFDDAPIAEQLNLTTIGLPWDEMLDGVIRTAKRRLAGDTARAATPSEVKELRHEAKALKEVVADLTLENRLLKKSMTEDGDDEA
mgnify:CR=1 FL=1